MYSHTYQTVQPYRFGRDSPDLVLNVMFPDELTNRTQMSHFQVVGMQNVRGYGHAQRSHSIIILAHASMPRFGCYVKILGEYNYEMLRERFLPLRKSRPKNVLHYTR